MSLHPALALTTLTCVSAFGMRVRDGGDFAVEGQHCPVVQGPFDRGGAHAGEFGFHLAAAFAAQTGPI